MVYAKQRFKCRHVVAKKSGNLFGGGGVFLGFVGFTPHVRTMGCDTSHVRRTKRTRTCGGPNEAVVLAWPGHSRAHVLFYRSVCSEVMLVGVRAPSRSISPPWGSIRFRPPPRTYDAPPWGRIVRVVGQTKPRKIPTRNILSPLFREQDSAGGAIVTLAAGLLGTQPPRIRVFNSTRWGSTRLRSAPRTYDAPPCGPAVRVGSLTKLRKIPTRKMLIFKRRKQHLN